MLGFLPAVVLSFFSVWLPHPFSAVAGILAFALHLAAAAHRAGFLDDEALLETLRARAVAFWWWIFGLSILAAVTIAPPVMWMLDAAHVFAPLAVAVGIMAFLAIALRFWCLPALLFVWSDARQGSGESAWLVLARSRRLAWRLGGRVSEALQLGIPSVLLIALVCAAPLLSTVLPESRSSLLLLAGAYALGLSPLSAIALLKLAEKALFEPAVVEVLEGHAERASNPVSAELESPQVPVILSEAALEPVHCGVMPVQPEIEVPVLEASKALLPETIERLLAVASFPEIAVSPVVEPVNLLLLLDEPTALRHALAIGRHSPQELVAAAHLSVARDRLEALEPLLEAGWNPALAAPDGESLIERALRSSSGATVKSLLSGVLTAPMLDSGRSPALVAALNGKRHDLPNIVRLLVKYGADPRREGPDGANAVSLAVKREQSELLPFLLKSPSSGTRSQDMGGATPARDTDLIGIAQRGEVARLGEALKSVSRAELRGTTGTTALVHAAGRGHRTVVEMLLSAGASPTECLSNGSSAFSAAALAGHADVVGLLMRSGCSVDQPLMAGATALLLAASRWRYATVSNLLRAGADPQRASEGEFTALSAAAAFVHQARAASGGRETMQALIKAGANVSQANAEGQTPVMLLLGAALRPGSVARDEVVLDYLRLLLTAGAGVNQFDCGGRTAIHWTAVHGLIGAAELLLKAQAQLRVADGQGRYPIDLAHHAGQTEYVAWLVQQGADH